MDKYILEKLARKELSDEKLDLLINRLTFGLQRAQDVHVPQCAIKAIVERCEVRGIPCFGVAESTVSFATTYCELAEHEANR